MIKTGPETEKTEKNRMLRRAINFIKGFHYTRKMNTQKKCNIHWHTEIDTKTQFEGCNTVMPHVGLADCKIVFAPVVAKQAPPGLSNPPKKRVSRPALWFPMCEVYHNLLNQTTINRVGGGA